MTPKLPSNVPSFTKPYYVRAVTSIQYDFLEEKPENENVIFAKVDLLPHEFALIERAQRFMERAQGIIKTRIGIGEALADLNKFR